MSVDQSPPAPDAPAVPDPPAVPDRPAGAADGGGAVGLLAQWAAANPPASREPDDGAGAAAWSADLPESDDDEGPAAPPALADLAARVGELALQVTQLRGVVNRLSRRQDRVDAVWPEEAGDVFGQWFAMLADRYHFTSPEAAGMLEDSASLVELQGLHLWWQEAFGRNPDGHEQALWHEHLIDILERRQYWPKRAGRGGHVAGFTAGGGPDPEIV